MNRKIIIYATALVAVFFLAIFLGPQIKPQQESYSMIVEEETPMGAPVMLKTYESGYGVSWTKDEASDSTVFTGYSGPDVNAKLTLIGNTSDLPSVVGLTREAAEKIVGIPLTQFNNITISALNTPSKAYYKVDQNLLILYYDVQSPSKVLFALQINNDIATKTRVFTSLKLDTAVLPDTETMTMDLLNAVRIAYGKKTLTIDPKIVVVSRVHSQSMVDNNYFSHDNPAKQGPKERLKAAKIPYRNYGEALTAGTWTPMDAVIAWMNSPGHRNIILGDFTSGGIGIASGNATYGIYFTLNVIKN